jgi:hypothetical protein
MFIAVEVADQVQHRAGQIDDAAGKVDTGSAIGLAGFGLVDLFALRARRLLCLRTGLAGACVGRRLLAGLCIVGRRLALLRRLQMRVEAGIAGLATVSGLRPRRRCGRDR